jgi:hypothetical protein
MESKPLSSPVSNPPAETLPSEQPSVLDAAALAEVVQVIAADCRLAPEQYLDEIRMAASGE